MWTCSWSTVGQGGGAGGGDEGGHKTEVIAFSQPDGGSYKSSAPEVYSFYKRIRDLGVPTPPVFAYWSGFFVNKTET